MFQIIIRIIAVIIALIGVTLIYDSRIITKNFFGFGDQNEATTGLKIVGFFIAILGGVIAYLVKWNLHNNYLWKNSWNKKTIVIQYNLVLIIPNYILWLNAKGREFEK